MMIFPLLISGTKLLCYLGYPVISIEKRTKTPQIEWIARKAVN